MAHRERLDRILVQRGLAVSRERARALILAGRVLVDDRVVDKAGAQVADDRAIRVKGEDIPYVSRGGLKLAKALEHFQLNVANRVAIDVGASTGGFTDCLLQQGAALVYAVDVGYGQLAWSLRNDPRVVNLERTNIRHLSPETLPEAPDLAVIDASFISLDKVLPPTLRLLRAGATVVALIKPQFEVGRGQVGKGGVVRDPERHRQVVTTVSRLAQTLGCRVLGVVESPITGPKGNREFLLCLEWRGGAGASPMSEGEVAMETDCIFCKVVAGEIPADIVYRDEQVVAFRDISPQAPHHLLLVPVRHVPTTLDLTEGEDALVGYIHRVAAKLARELGFAEAGFRLVNNCNAGAGQTVWHLHFHLLGGRPLNWPPG